jgi:hypothetical protein
MKPNPADEVADRAAEERSEDEGMPEHPAKARDPVRWAAERGERVIERRAPGHTGMFGGAFVACAALAALASVRGALRRMRHKGGAARLPR